MDQQLQSRFLKLAILLVLVDVLCFNHLIELRGEEPRRSIVAIEMLESGNYAIPHIYDEIYYNKPPVHNWLIAGSMSVFGTGEWAARLPGVLAFLITAWMLFLVVRKYLNHDTALLVAFAFLTSSDLLFYGSVNAAEIDLFYTLVVMLQALAIFKYRQTEEYLKLFLISYLLAAIGVLTKGIPSIAFQGLTLLVYLAMTARFLKLFSWQHLAGIGLFSCIVLGYLYYFSLSEDVWAFLSQQFKEASQRTGNESSWLDLLKQFFYFPVLLLEKLFPWSLFTIFFAFKPVRKYIWNNPLLKFSVIFILANILVYWTAPDLRVRYIYMFFPFFILLLVASADKIQWNTYQIALGVQKFILFGIVMSAVAFIALPFILQIEVGVGMVFSLLVALVIVGLIWIYIRNRSAFTLVWILILVLLIGRLGYNITVLPEMSRLSDRLKYRETVAEMIESADGRPIFLTGPAEVLHPDISIFGHTFYEHDLAYPPEAPFQVPYYYAHQSGRIMKYDPTPESQSACYLMNERDLSYYPGKKAIQYRFYNEYNKQTLVLFAPY
ncbi:glycosyltransferase family 39 protein [Crocinitomix catalasitica]|nr:glycosyltransferase family 39 protein [Crocinitomix catalasitica]